MIFISYRVSDSQAQVDRLDADLQARYGKEAVFRDKSRLRGGDDWTDALQSHAASCRVMLVVIGKNWQTTTFTDPARVGVLRISDEQDWVRKEIRIALDEGRLVIPLLLDGVSMPQTEWLSRYGLASLATKQSMPLRLEPNYQADLARLVACIEERANLASQATRPPRQVALNQVVQATPRRLIYEKVPVQGFVAFDNIVNPYGDLFDATDSSARRLHVTAYLWIPHSNVFIGNQLQNYTPCAVVCCLNVREVLRRLIRVVGKPFLERIDRIPPNLRREEKAQLLQGARSAFEVCFEVAVTFPKIYLEIGVRKPGAAYDVIVNGFVLPLLRLHRIAGVESLNVVVADVGADYNADLVKKIKAVAKLCYPGQKNGVTVQFCGRGKEHAILMALSRVFGWSVAHMHNSGKSEWIDILEEPLEREHRGNPRLEFPL